MKPQCSNQSKHICSHDIKEDKILFVWCKDSKETRPGCKVEYFYGLVFSVYMLFVTLFYNIVRTKQEVLNICL